MREASVIPAIRAGNITTAWQTRSIDFRRGFKKSVRRQELSDSWRLDL
jgi:hypothetical protein